MKKNHFGSVKWVGAIQAAKILAQLIGAPLFAHLLSPKDFGLMAMATTVVTFALLFRDMGTGQAVIQKKELTEDTLNSVFAFNILVGVAACAIIAGASHIIARLFSEPRLENVLLWASISFPIASLGAAQQAFLERELQFRKLAVVETASTYIALVASLLLAKFGFGVYALVTNAILANSLSTLSYWYINPWRPRFRFKWASFKEVSSYSSNLFGFVTVNYFARNSDSILIGKFLGAASLGIYGLAYKFMLFPLQNISSVFNRAMLPAMSRAYDSGERVDLVYAELVQRVALLAFPVMTGLWLLRTEFVAVVLGSAWVRVSDVIFYLAPIGMIQAITTTSGLLYTCTGKTKSFFYWGILSSAVQVAGIAIGLRYGILGVSRGYALANIILLYPMYYFGSKCINASPNFVFSALIRPACATALLALCVSVALLFAPEFEGNLGQFVRLLVGASAGAIAYGVAVRWLYPTSYASLVLKLRRAT
ncbi:lipopolysaccharide biosynthesis protein [Paraburkholderia madseniana]|jgi:O-antigen/teichoic acid export membrane protein|uniref:lipopolysaccharide biosynthesis protein n=1 Tax=Paraburkholderia TaxID=1822464 RepID=UPI0038BB6E9C